MYDDVMGVRSPASSFSERLVEVIRAIPYGRVATYGQLAALAGSPLAARQVVRILHSSARSRQLPWQRVVNREGRIGLPRGAGYEEQQQLLEAEGIEFGLDGRIDLATYQWIVDRVADR